MCKKDVSPLDGHLTHHDSRLHDCTDGLHDCMYLSEETYAVNPSIVELYGTF